MIVKAKFRSGAMLFALLALCACGGSSTQATQVQVVRQPAPAPMSIAAPAPQLQGFQLWLSDFKREALSKGISQQVLDNAFAGIDRPLQDVLDRDQTQPEKTKTFDEYLKGALKQKKIDAAREERDEHAELLAQVEQAYGVPGPILVSLWSTESNFGKIQGNFSIIESLATLAYDGRRAAFFRTQLLDALMILQQENMPASSLIGSWAGAMGQTQFMPSSFLSFAVDFDGDGKRDIWNSDADALGSMANYLKTRGWNPEIGWGFHVRVPRGSEAVEWAHDKEKLPLKDWKKRGIKMANGARLPKGDYEARLVIPDDDTDNAYLVTPNYEVLMDWNHSIYFATSVGLLADAIAAKE